MMLFRKLADSTCWCPDCGTRLSADDINVTTDWALCRRCGSATRFSVLMTGSAGPKVDLSKPPKGASLLREGNRTIVSATTRSMMAWILIPFTCVWSGSSMAGIYGNQFQRGVFDLKMSLFGIPFILGTLILACQTIMSAVGRVTVTREGDDGVVFTGVGPFGSDRRFRWSEMESVKEGIGIGYMKARNGVPSRSIVLNFRPGTRPALKFGSMLTDERRWFLMGAINSELGHR